MEASMDREEDLEGLLPYYEAELRHLHEGAARFAAEHPALAQRLEISGEGWSEDPQLQQLMQSAAFLNACLSRELEDDFPAFTGPVLERLAPQVLRPFPSCAIVAFEPALGAPAPAEPVTLARGTALRTPQGDAAQCRLRTAFEVVRYPLRVAEVRFSHHLGACTGAFLPAGTTALLSLRLALTARDAAWPAPALRPLRLFLDGEAPQVAAVREALAGQVLGTLVQADPAGPWRSTRDNLPRPVGFGADEALLDSDDLMPAAYRLLTEYFCFPEKFDFVDLPWPAELQAAAGREVVLHYALGGIVAGSAQAQWLQALTPAQLVPGCTPVVNLFSQRARLEPIAHETAAWFVRAAAQPMPGCAVYSVDKVWCEADEARPGQARQEISSLLAPFHEDGDPAQRFWQTRHGGRAGPELTISLLDAGMRPAPLLGGTLAADITVTDGDRPHDLAPGRPGGDLVLMGGSVLSCVRLLCRPTPSRRFGARGRAAWLWLSHLTLNPLSLCDCGVEALQDMLRLHDLPRSARNERIVAALRGIGSERDTAWRHDPAPLLVRGTVVQLSLDEDAFAGTGLRLFAQVLERFFPLYVHAHSFTRLRIASARDGRRLYRGEACPGERPLL
jgi:type VI secretion system protein ImpG